MRKIASFLALLIVVLGAVILVGWHSENLRLIQVHESVAPMHYNTALGFLILGISLLFLVSGRTAWSAVPAAALSLMSVLTLGEYIFGVSLGIDGLFLAIDVSGETGHPARMELSAALCFLLSGAAILSNYFLPPASRSARWSGILSSAVLGFAFVAFSGYAAGVESAGAWGKLTQMPVHTSAGFLLAGAALMFLALAAVNSIVLARWVSLSAGIGLAAAGAGLWQALANEQNERISTQLESRSRELVTVITLGIEHRVTALERMANRWTDATPRQELLWRKDAAACIATIPGFQAIEWVDAHHIVRWVEPLHGNEQAVGLDLDDEPERRNALQMAENLGRPVSTNNIDLVQGGKGFLLFVPIGEKGATTGFILAVFRIAPLFDTLAESVSNDFDIAVFQDDRAIYGAPSTGDGLMHALDLLGNTWRIQLTPKPAYLRLLESTLPIQVLFGSLAVSILSGVAIFFAQTAHKGLKTARQAEEALRESERYHRAVVEELPIGLLTVNEAGLVEFANDGALRLFEYERSELLGQPIQILVPKNVRAKHSLNVSQYIRTPERRSMGRGRELFALTKNGRELPIEIGLAPLRHNGSLQIMASVVDISRRKHAEMALAKLNRELENRVRARTAELEAANRELDEFTYIASHDLQEPLRKQQMFTAILNEEVGDEISGDAQRAMRAINNASVRMQELVQSLLALSRARNREMNVRRVSLTQIVGEALNSLSLLISETNTRVKVGRLPEVTCDPVLVTQVFQNLIANGIRFVKDGEKPVITLNARKRDSLVEVDVKDFGIGIPEDSLDTIFAPFKRLHARHEYPGTGIGLSVCKKVVERHGGTIWVESEVGRGSVFLFTLSDNLKGWRHAEQTSSNRDYLVGGG